MPKAALGTAPNSASPLPRAGAAGLGLSAGFQWHHTAHTHVHGTGPGHVLTPWPVLWWETPTLMFRSGSSWRDRGVSLCVPLLLGPLFPILDFGLGQKGPNWKTASEAEHPKARNKRRAMVLRELSLGQSPGLHKAQQLSPFSLDLPCTAHAHRHLPTGLPTVPTWLWAGSTNGCPLPFWLALYLLPIPLHLFVLRAESDTKTGESRAQKKELGAPSLSPNGAARQNPPPLSLHHHQKREKPYRLYTNLFCRNTS